MQLVLVAVRDRALDTFGRPIFAHTLGQAIRSFQDEINRADPNNEMHRHPEDYDLYHLGYWDDQTGEFHNIDKPKQIAIGNQLSTRSST